MCYPKFNLLVWHYFRVHHIHRMEFTVEVRLKTAN